MIQWSIQIHPTKTSTSSLSRSAREVGFFAGKLTRRLRSHLVKEPEEKRGSRYSGETSRDRSVFSIHAESQVRFEREEFKFLALADRAGSCLWGVKGRWYSRHFLCRIPFILDILDFVSYSYRYTWLCLTKTKFSWRFEIDGLQGISLVDMPF